MSRASKAFFGVNNLINIGSVPTKVFDRTRDSIVDSLIDYKMDYDTKKIRFSKPSQSDSPTERID